MRPKVIVFCILSLLLIGHLSSARPGENDPSVGIQVRLDYPNVRPPDGAGTNQYYHVFDRDFAHGPIGGHVRVGSTMDRAGKPREVLLDSSGGNWTEHLSARLFRDDLEVGPAEFEVTFNPGRKSVNVDPRAPSVLLGKDRTAEAVFTLSGPNGSALDPGLYRLWVVLDMRGLPSKAKAFRGFAVDDAADYHSDPEANPIHSGGVVFRVQPVDDDPQVMARYLAQRANLEAIEAMKFEGRDSPDREQSAHHRRKAIELSLRGLQHAPRDVELLAITARNHVMLGDCAAAQPYIKLVYSIAPDYLKPEFYNNMFMRTCIAAEQVVPDGN